MIGFNVPIEKNERDKCQTKIWIRNLNKVKKEEFAKKLSMQPWEDLTVQNVDQMVEQLDLMFMQTLDEFAPLKEVKLKDKITPMPSLRLKKLRRKRDNARSKKQVKRLRKLRALCLKVSKHENVTFAKRRIEKGQREVWKMLSEFSGKYKGDQKIILMQNDQAMQPEDIPESFNDYFTHKIKNIKENIPEYKGDILKGAKIRASNLGIEKSELQMQSVSEEEVACILKKMKPSNCPDMYGIAPAALKLAPQVLKVPLAFVINTVIHTGEVPKRWKVARVLPLHKKDKKSDVKNYRPVSILPSMSKVLEEVLRRQLSRHLEKRRVLPHSQFGFRKGLSTVQAFGAAQHDWLEAKQKGLECGTLLFDLSAAFDTIDCDWKS